MMLSSFRECVMCLVYLCCVLCGRATHPTVQMFYRVDLTTMGA